MYTLIVVSSKNVELVFHRRDQRMKHEDDFSFKQMVHPKINVLGSIVSKFKRGAGGGGGIELLKISNRFNFIT